MSFYENLKNNRVFWLKSTLDLIEEERDRIATQKLASSEDINGLMTQWVSNIIKERNPEMVADIHLKLKSVKLPGDFEKVAAEEEVFYIALDIPYEGEKFYDLSGLKDDKEELEEEEEEELEEDDAIDLVALNDIAERLNKIAYNLGSNGNHEAAYLIERTVIDIKNINEV